MKKPAILCALAAFALLSCPNVAPPLNQAPVNVQAHAASIALDIGESTTLNCTATDPDGDALGYTWLIVTGGGSLSSTSGASVSYTAPNGSGSVQVKCTADDGNGHGVDSNILAITVAVSRAPVTNFVAVTGNGQLVLRWTNPTKTTFDHVMVRRSTSAYPETVTEGNLAYSGSNQTYTDIGLTNGAPYYYSAFAINTLGEAATPQTASGIPSSDTTPPANATNFLATPTAGAVALSWTNPADADFAGVKLIRNATATPASYVDGTTLLDLNTGASYNDTGLVNGTTYYYALYTVDAHGNYSSGVTLQATPFRDTTPPGVVTSFVAAAANGKVSLSWKNPTDYDFAGVKILRKTGSESADQNDGSNVYTGAGQSYVDLTVANGTTYFYTAFAYDSSGNYSAGNGIVATPSATLPNAYILSVVKSYTSPEASPLSAYYDGSYIWWFATSSNSLYQVDEATGEVLSSKVLNVARGNMMTLTPIGGVLTSVRRANILARLDLGTKAVVDGISIPAAQMTNGMAYDGIYYWALSIWSSSNTWGGGTYNRFVKIDATTGSSIVDFPTPGTNGGTAGMAWDGTYLYIGNNRDGKIYVMKKQDGTKVAEITLPYSASASGYNIGNMYFDDQGFLWICDVNTSMFYKCSLIKS